MSAQFLNGIKWPLLRPKPEFFGVPSVLPRVARNLRRVTVSATRRAIAWARFERVHCGRRLLRSEHGEAGQFHRSLLRWEASRVFNELAKQRPSPGPGVGTSARVIVTLA